MLIECVRKQTVLLTAQLTVLWTTSGIDTGDRKTPQSTVQQSPAHPGPVSHHQPLLLWNLSKHVCRTFHTCSSSSKSHDFTETLNTFISRPSRSFTSCLMLLLMFYRGCSKVLLCLFHRKTVNVQFFSTFCHWKISSLFCVIPASRLALCWWVWTFCWWLLTLCWCVSVCVLTWPRLAVSSSDPGVMASVRQTIAVLSVPLFVSSSFRDALRPSWRKQVMCERCRGCLVFMEPTPLNHFPLHPPHCTCVCVCACVLAFPLHEYSLVCVCLIVAAAVRPELVRHEQHPHTHTHTHRKVWKWWIFTLSLFVLRWRCPCVLIKLCQCWGVRTGKNRLGDNCWLFVWTDPPVVMAAF